MSVRFTRVLEPGDRGPDVEGVGRALARAKLMGPLSRFVQKPRRVRRTYGVGKTAAVKKLQKRRGLKQTGRYGKQEHILLAPHFDAYAASLMDAWKAPDADDSVRARAVAKAMAYYRERSHIAYSQARPTQLAAPRKTRRLDCSGLVAAVMHFTGVLPNVDWRWTNTWIQIKLGHPVELAHAKPGDVVFYGTSVANPTHEALYIGNGHVVSNGHYPMGLYPVDYRSDRVAIRDFIGSAS